MKAESKAIIFGRYLGQKIIHNSEIRNEILIEISLNDDLSNYVIQLKSLLSISENDLLLLANINGMHTYDTLRQLGYATDQTVIEDGKVVTYTVEDLVNEGVYKLS